MNACQPAPYSTFLGFSECDVAVDTIECDGSFFASSGPFPPNADIVLQIDPVGSYLGLTGPLYSDTVSVSGGATARISPDRFLTAVVWADDAALGPIQLDDWRFWIDSPVIMDLESGEFTVEPGDVPVLNGSGFRNGDVWDAVLHPHEVATGIINNQTDTWDLDYVEDGFGWSIELHLEGSFHEI